MNVKKFLEAETKNHAGSHAYLLIGNRAEADLVIEFIIESREILPIDISRVGQEPEAVAQKEIKVEETRRLLREISFSPQGKQRLAVIYNCEKLNASSGNVLLKNLEEPAGPVIFVLVASSSSVLSTIKSRCRILNLNSLDSDDHIREEAYIMELKKGFPEATILIEKVIKEEKTAALVQELITNQRRKLLHLKDLTFANNLEEIESAKRKIVQNGNQRLILECLILKIAKDL